MAEALGSACFGNARLIGRGAYHVQTRPNEILLAEQKGIRSCDLLSLGNGVFLGVNSHTSLGTTEGHIDDSALQTNVNNQILLLVNG